jgi:hypothetical protein
MDMSHWTVAGLTAAALMVGAWITHVFKPLLSGAANLHRRRVERKELERRNEAFQRAMRERIRYSNQLQRERDSHDPMMG